jgi:hypothetical protein
MKKLFIGALVLNLLIEWMAASSLIFAGETMVLGGSADGLMWSRIYGFAALAIGSTVIWAWPSRDDLKAVTLVLGLMCTFHISILTALATSANQQAGTVIHAVLSVLFITLFVTRKKWCGTE